MVIPVRRGLGAAGSVLGPAELYNLALGAGFPPDTAVKMAAIALKESGGNPAAYNGVPPDDSYGLWQINLYDRPPGYRARIMAQLGISSPSQLFDPAQNAAAAFSLWGGNDSNLNVAWAINDGGVNQSRYQNNLPVVMAAVGAPADSSAPVVAGNTGGTTLPGGFTLPAGLDPTTLGLMAAAAGLAIYAIA